MSNVERVFGLPVEGNVVGLCLDPNDKILVVGMDSHVLAYHLDDLIADSNSKPFWKYTTTGLKKIQQISVRSLDTDVLQCVCLLDECQIQCLKIDIENQNRESILN